MGNSSNSCGIELNHRVDIRRVSKRVLSRLSLSLILLWGIRKGSKLLVNNSWMIYGVRVDPDPIFLFVLSRDRSPWNKKSLCLPGPLPVTSESHRPLRAPCVSSPPVTQDPTPSDVGSLRLVFVSIVSSHDGPYYWHFYSISLGLLVRTVGHKRYFVL